MTEPTHWYQGQITFASLIASLIANVIALGVFLINRRHSKILAREAAGQALMDAIDKSNAAFIQTGAYSPIAFGCKIKKSDSANYSSFTAKAVMLYNQVNLVRMIYTYRASLDPVHLEIYEKRWAPEIVMPWIEQDPDLMAVWKHTVIFERFEDPNNKFGQYILSLWPLRQMEERCSQKEK